MPVFPLNQPYIPQIQAAEASPASSSGAGGLSGSGAPSGAEADAADAGATWWDDTGEIFYVKREDDTWHELIA